MPIFIPILLIAGSALTGGAGLKDIVSSQIQKKKAKKRYDCCREIYEQMEQRVTTEGENAKANFQSLYECKLEAVKTIRSAAEFLRKATVKKRDLKEDFEIPVERIDEWEGDSVKVMEFLTGLGKSAGAGISSASTAYSLVGLLGNASTGTAISLLSGAAARSATLAWLGGGSLVAGGGGMALGGIVLNGLLIGPGVLVTGLFEKGRARKLETEVEREIAKMEVSQAQKGLLLAKLQAVVQRVSELTTAIVELNNILKSLLDYGDPDNMKDAYKVYNSAKALGELLDTKVTGDDESL